MEFFFFAQNTDNENTYTVLKKPKASFLIKRMAILRPYYTELGLKSTFYTELIYENVVSVIHPYITGVNENSCKYRWRCKLYLLNRNNSSVTCIEPVTFKSLNMHESDVEEIVRKNINIFFDENDDSILIIGQQVTNTSKGRCDLVGLDGKGNIVLIEIKRDKSDTEHRKEPLEWQAIRYAVNFAALKNDEELIVRDVYVPYIHNHPDEFDDYYKKDESGQYKEDERQTLFEYAMHKLNTFKEDNGITICNQKQRILLIASDYDDSTLSSIAWLNANNLDIACYRFQPIQSSDQVFLNIEKVFPLCKYDDYYIRVRERINSENEKNGEMTESVARQSKPRLPQLMEWGVIKEGAELTAKNTKASAILCSGGVVRPTKDGDGNPVDDNNAEEISPLQWLKSLYGWSAVSIYNFILVDGESLSKLRDKAIQDRDM